MQKPSSFLFAVVDPIAKRICPATGPAQCLETGASLPSSLAAKYEEAEETLERP